MIKTLTLTIAFGLLAWVAGYTAKGALISMHRNDIVAAVGIIECKKTVGVIIVHKDGTVHGLQPQEYMALKDQIDTLPDDRSLIAVAPCGQQL